MKKTKPQQPQTPPRPLADDTLAQVTGGDGPRDPATGLPTGRRQ